MKNSQDKTGVKIYRKTVIISCVGMWHRMHFLYLKGLHAFWTAGLTTGNGTKVIQRICPTKELMMKEALCYSRLQWTHDSTGTAAMSYLTVGWH